MTSNTTQVALTHSKDSAIHADRFIQHCQPKRSHSSTKQTQSSFSKDDQRYSSIQAWQDQEQKQEPWDGLLAVVVDGDWHKVRRQDTNTEHMEQKQRSKI